MLTILLLLIAQWSTVNAGSTLPPVCNVGDVFISTTTPTLSKCNTGNVWTTMLVFGPIIPQGSILIVNSGTCPSGYTEQSSLSGKTLIGTVAANGDVGSVGGADSIVPAGTVTAPTFTGNVNTLAVTAHTVVATKQGTAAGNVVTTATHTITGIPGGMNSIPAFTGTQFDNRSAYMKVIFCKKD